MVARITLLTRDSDMDWYRLGIIEETPPSVENEHRLDGACGGRSTMVPELFHRPDPYVKLYIRE